MNRDRQLRARCRGTICRTVRPDPATTGHWRVGLSSPRTGHSPSGGASTRHGADAQTGNSRRTRQARSICRTSRPRPIHGNSRALQVLHSSTAPRHAVSNCAAVESNEELRDRSLASGRGRSRQCSTHVRFASATWVASASDSATPTTSAKPRSAKAGIRLSCIWRLSSTRDMQSSVVLAACE